MRQHCRRFKAGQQTHTRHLPTDANQHNSNIGGRRSVLDRINHIVLALALRAVCGDANIAKAMLESIQHMKYYQRTGRGDSNTFLSSIDELLQGKCQGNTAGLLDYSVLNYDTMLHEGGAGQKLYLLSPPRSLPSWARYL